MEGGLNLCETLPWEGGFFQGGEVSDITAYRSREDAGRRGANRGERASSRWKRAPTAKGGRRGERKSLDKEEAYA